MKIARLLLRAIVGGLFVGHGTQKLFGWFGGHGLEGTAAGFESMGLHPAKANAIASGASEALGGAALAAGYQTPLAASALIGTMLVAIRSVHFKNGPWSQDGGYEYNLVLLLAALTIAETGPGPISLDALRNKEKQGTRWALLALALAAAGAAGVDALAAKYAASDVVEDAPIPADEGADVTVIDVEIASENGTE